MVAGRVDVLTGTQAIELDWLKGTSFTRLFIGFFMSTVGMGRPHYSKTMSGGSKPTSTSIGGSASMMPSLSSSESALSPIPSPSMSASSMSSRGEGVVGIVDAVTIGIGQVRIDFDIAERNGLVILPHTPAEGCPWIFYASVLYDYLPQILDTHEWLFTELLQAGFAIAGVDDRRVDVQDLCGVGCSSESNRLSHVAGLGSAQTPCLSKADEAPGIFVPEGKI